MPTLSTEKTVRDTLQRTLGFVRTAEPKAEASVSVSSEHTAHTRFARNEITTSGDGDEYGLSVTVTLGLRHASSHTNQLDDASLRSLVERTVAMARLSPENPETMPVLGAQTYGKSPLAFDPEISKLDPTARAKVAKQVIDAGRGDSLQVAGFLMHGAGLTGKATSAGMLALHPSAWASLSMTARTADGTGSGHEDNASRRWRDIDVAAMAARACATSVTSKQPKKLEAGHYTVVMAPLAANEFAGQLVGLLDARSADEGRSVFAKPGGGTREKQKVLNDLVTIRSDWSSPDAPALPFDSEGLPLRPITWVDKGVLTQLASDRYWAKKHGRVATNHPTGYVMERGTSSHDAMIKGIKRGVLISRFWYTRWLDEETAMLTGLTRDGTFLIENGEIAGSVNNFRFNQSVVEALKNIDAMASTLSLTGHADARVPEFRTNDFYLASTSDAV